MKLMFTNYCQCICKDRNALAFDRNGHQVGKARNVPFIKYESDYVHIKGENDTPNIRYDDNIRENGVCDHKSSNDVKMNPVADDQPSFTNRLDSPTEEEEISDESLLLRVPKGHKCGLHMKHSACLFCFSNHPKHMVLSSISKSRSMDKMNLLDDGSRSHEFHFNSNKNKEFNFLNKSRRESIHLSLTDVTLRHDECLS